MLYYSTLNIILQEFSDVTYLGTHLFALNVLVQRLNKSTEYYSVFLTAVFSRQPFLTDIKVTVRYGVAVAQQCTRRIRKRR